MRISGTELNEQLVFVKHEVTHSKVICSGQIKVNTTMSVTFVYTLFITRDQFQKMPKVFGNSSKSLAEHY